jgi:hypothetical protein
MQKKERLFPRIALVLGLSLLFACSMAVIFPARIAFGQGTTGSPWVSSGAFLNYTTSANWSGRFALSNGSSMSITGNVTGSFMITVNSVTSLNANITSTPNIALEDKLTYFNGTAQFNGESLTSANASTTIVPLDQLNFGNLMQRELNSTSSLYSFSPTFNASLSTAPGVMYQYNSNTKVPALYLSSSISEQTSIPSSLLGSTTGSYSLNGTSAMYVALVQDIPLKETISLEGSATLSSLQLSAIAQSASGSGSLTASVTLSATNVNLSAGNSVEQSTVKIPSYSTSLDVMSNSTIDNATTSGNELTVAVTGPSGTTGVLDVVVSSSLLTNAGITSTSQIGVTLDGNTYTNYTVTDVGGSYVFTIYYHHSSHKIAMSFGNANLGTNNGSILSVSGSSTYSSPISTTTILEIVSVVVVVVVVVAVVGFMRRSKTSSMQGTASPPPAQ